MTIQRSLETVVRNFFENFAKAFRECVRVYMNRQANMDSKDCERKEETAIDR